VVPCRITVKFSVDSSTIVDHFYPKCSGASDKVLHSKTDQKVAAWRWRNITTSTAVAQPVVYLAADLEDDLA
jgi:hypothetical protein